MHRSFSAERLAIITNDLVEIKRTYFPNRLHHDSHRLEWLLAEIKGVALRTAFRTGDRRKQRHHLGFLDHIFDLIQSNGGLLSGRVFIKRIGGPMSGMAVYTSAVQKICTDFHQLLVEQREDGIVVLDSRRKSENERTSFSIFTQKFRALGDPFPRIREAPLFGHSNNHAGLQIADILVSGLLFPMAAHTYCSGYVANVHVDPSYLVLRARYGQRLKNLQYRYRAQGQLWRGGLVVTDPLGHRNVTHLFT